MSNFPPPSSSPPSPISLLSEELLALCLQRVDLSWRIWGKAVCKLWKIVIVEHGLLDDIALNVRTTDRQLFALIKENAGKKSLIDKCVARGSPVSAEFLLNSSSTLCKLSCVKFPSDAFLRGNHDGNNNNNDEDDAMTNHFNKKRKNADHQQQTTLFLLPNLSKLSVQEAPAATDVYALTLFVRQNFVMLRELTVPCCVFQMSSRDWEDDVLVRLTKLKLIRYTGTDQEFHTHDVDPLEFLLSVFARRRQNEPDFVPPLQNLSLLCASPTPLHLIRHRPLHQEEIDLNFSWQGSNLSLSLRKLELWCEYTRIATLQQVLDASFSSLTDLHLSGMRFLQQPIRFPSSVETLKITHCSGDSINLAVSLQSLTRLKNVTFRICRFFPDMSLVAEAIATPQLTSLDITRSGFCEASREMIASRCCSSLTTLSIDVQTYRANGDDIRGLGRIISRCPLKHLTLDLESHSGQASPTLAAAFVYCTTLETISLVGKSWIRPPFLHAIASGCRKSLRVLSLECTLGCEVVQEAAVTLAAALLSSMGDKFEEIRFLAHGGMIRDTPFAEQEVEEEEGGGGENRRARRRRRRMMRAAAAAAMEEREEGEEEEMNSLPPAAFSNTTAVAVRPEAEMGDEQLDDLLKALRKCHPKIRFVPLFDRLCGK